MANNTTNQAVSYPKDSIDLLKRKLSGLRLACYPAPDIIRPSFSFKPKQKFVPYIDVLKKGFGFLEPSELKEETWKSKQELAFDDISFIVVKDKKWFYNKTDKTGQFFLEDGSRKVEIEFPSWMEMSKVIKVPGVLEAIRNVLDMCMGASFPNEASCKQCFSDNLCREIYCKNPSKETVGFAVLEMVEVLRRETIKVLVDKKKSKIVSMRDFKQYTKSSAYSSKDAEEEQVRKYLSLRKTNLFDVARKCGLLKKSANLLKYKNLRDHMRHSDEVDIKYTIKPNEIYDDFCAALGVRSCKSRKARWDVFGNNTYIILQFGCYEFLRDLLDPHGNPKGKRNIDWGKYYNALDTKGILSSTEIKKFDKFRLNCNNVAHVDHEEEKPCIKVLKEKEMFNFAEMLCRRLRELGYDQS